MKRDTDSEDYYTDTYTHRPCLGYRNLQVFECIVESNISDNFDHSHTVIINMISSQSHELT